MRQNNSLKDRVLLGPEDQWKRGESVEGQFNNFVRVRELSAKPDKTM